MKLGIEEIGYYLPSNSINNFDRKAEFEIDDVFIREKIGFQKVARKNELEKSSDLCVRAFENLQTKKDFNKNEIECLIVITQNPDFNLPHTSAIVHGLLDLPETCASFDVSLGCSGYVYGLSIITAFMEMNGLKKGLLFTSDQYSPIINDSDKNTSLLFGDAATVSLISDTPVFKLNKFSFGTIGKDYKELINEEKLYMNGRSIFNFAARYVPTDIKKIYELHQINSSDVDLYIFHQGSKYMLETIVKRLNLPIDKVPFAAVEYGNTISSSIPMILKDYLRANQVKKVILSGFGVGLSWASTLITK